MAYTRWLAVAALAASAASAATAQTAPSSGNPPGNTLAPQAVATAPAPPAIDPAPGRTPAAATTTGAEPTAAQIALQKYRTAIVCRTSIETGSLIARRRTCLTAKQWEYVDQQHRDEARRMMLDNLGRPNAN